MINIISMLLASVFLICAAPSAFASDLVREPVSIDLKDKDRLQRGAKLFMNYCSGCHSLKYMRYNRMAEELGLTTFDGQLDEDLLKNNLIFTTASVYDPIRIAMLPEDAKQWFGMVPPDLSLSARDRGTEWIYNYLRSFYSDNSRPFGTNNLLVPDVAMPNVLEPLIGKIILINNKVTHAPELVLIEHGEMYQAEFDSAIKDLVTFLEYVGEPAKMVRYQMGIFVILFLCLFFIITYRLKTIYWRRIK